MSTPVLLDENLEHEVCYRLRNDGHDVEHVDFHDQLQKGDDDDFEEYYDESDYWGVLFFTDNDWSAADVADTVHRILTLYPPSELQGMDVVGREWL